MLEDGNIARARDGTPQGGVISPLLANVFLHYVLDTWFHDTVKPRLRGRAFLVRYADDFVIVCERRDDAERVYAVLPQRFAKYGLTLHPEKTRLLGFRRPSGSADPASFDFLGFTHLWTRTRRGGWAVKQQTAGSRLRRKLVAISTWCRRNRHRPVAEQHATLSRKINGHCAYYGITGNSRRLAVFRWQVERIWRKWLMRRSNATRKPWAWWNAFCRRWPLPPARAIHSTLRPS